MTSETSRLALFGLGIAAIVGGALAALTGGPTSASREAADGAVTPLSISATPSAVGRPRIGSDRRPGDQVDRPTAYGTPATSADASRLGRAAYQEGNLGESIGQYRLAADLDPTDAEALNNAGQALVRGNQASDAIAYFDRAIAIRGDEWSYHFNRARAYAEQGQWARAVAGYRDAQRLFPDDYATEFNLAKALQQRGDLQAAIEGFERAIVLAPDQADFHLSHGLALESAGQTRAAVAAYGRYLDLAPVSSEAERVRGRIAVIEAEPVR